jgi:hypothetical protein
LSEGKSSGLAIRGIKLGVLHPTQEHRLPHADRTRGSSPAASWSAEVKHFLRSSCISLIITQ